MAERKKEIIQNERAVPHFFFICINPNDLNGDGADVVLSKLFVILGGEGAKERFDRFKAFAEESGKMQRFNQKIRSHILPGEIHWVSTTTVRKILEEKRAHEMAYQRHPGHTSTHPPEFLTPTTAVIVIGSLQHLGLHTDLYFERTGALRRRTISTLLQLMGLKEAATAKRWDNSYVEAYPHGENESRQFYPGNFNRLWEETRKTTEKLTTREMFERISD